jgi:serine acetyltransferase
VIGRDAFIDEGVTIGDRVKIQNADWTVSPIEIAHGASIGAGAIVVAGCDVGEFAMVGAGAVVTHDVPAHAVFAGNPARVIGWVCACGQRLQDSTGHPAPATRERYALDPELTCPVCGRHYKFAGDDGTLQEQRGPAVTEGATA